MSENESVGFGLRIVMAFVLPWRLIFDGALAARVRKAVHQQALPEAAASTKSLAGSPQSPSRVQEVEPKQPKVATQLVDAVQSAKLSSSSGAVHLLSLLQREGRLLDFLTEDVSGYNDREVGAAARGVHEGCKKTLERYFELAAIRSEDEGSSVTLDVGFDPNSVRLVGNVTGEPPFHGTLAHPGWRVNSVSLPERSSDVDHDVISPAEVEL